VFAPALRTNGSVEGADGLAVAPESPLPWETVTPAATAASLKRRIRSSAVSGIG
jgi:hypothetical protein